MMKRCLYNGFKRKTAHKRKLMLILKINIRIDSQELDCKIKELTVILDAWLYRTLISSAIVVLLQLKGLKVISQIEYTV